MTKETDHWRPAPIDVLFAAGLLTRLPIPVDGPKAIARGAQAGWAYPVIGFGLGVIFVAITQCLVWMGLAALPATVIAVASMAMLTGAMHEDGLADVLDGFWGGWDKTRRLEIMKDSHIGVYGVIGLILIIGLKISLYADLATSAPFAALGLFAMSRAAMVVVMGAMPNARGTGLAQSVGRPSRNTCIVAVAVCVLTLPFVSFAAVVGVTLGACAVAAIAHKKIAGQTGDVLGSVQMISEITGLIVFAMVAV